MTVVERHERALSLLVHWAALSPMYVPAAVRKCSIARLQEVADMYPAFGSA